MSQHHALIIEDNPDSIHILARLLNNAGVTHAAISQPETLTEADLEGVTVVFLDLDMPGVNGYQVFGVLRSFQGFQVPIVAYTVNTNERAATRAMGFNGMIAKPLDASCFADQLRRILAGDAVWDDCS